MSTKTRIAIVGPCASGKSSVAKALQNVGYQVRQPAQEHSYVPDMWQKLTRPDILIFLDVNHEQVVARRPQNAGDFSHWQDQQQRLAHARRHCDLYLDTSGLTLAQVQARVYSFLGEWD